MKYDTYEEQLEAMATKILESRADIAFVDDVTAMETLDGNSIEINICATTGGEFSGYWGDEKKRPERHHDFTVTIPWELPVPEARKMLRKEITANMKRKAA